MITIPVITPALNTIFLALTPAQRWGAAHKQFSSNFMTEMWFTIMMATVITVLTAGFFWVTYNRRKQEMKSSDRLFAEHAEKRGLSKREHQVLLGVAGRAELRRSDSIFTLATAFDRGAAKMIEESLLQQTGEQNEQLKTELFFLREKLGFKKRFMASSGLLGKPKKLSSRQIPVGKKVHITRRKMRGSSGIESTIVRNSDTELAVKLTEPVEITFGEPWCARYYFGVSVWEFDTSAVSYDGDVLVLSHSDKVRFINRRRFLRVPVRKSAFIAHFPFSKTLTASSESEGKESGVNEDTAETYGGTWSPPEFIPAVITELAGPGLRMEAPLKVKVGERVLVVFRLDEENGHDSIASEEVVATEGDDKGMTSRIIEDVGEVRHTKVIQNGLSIAVELTGLSDSGINELIRATNRASLRASSQGHDESGSMKAVELAGERAGVQGI